MNASTSLGIWTEGDDTHTTYRLEMIWLAMGEDESVNHPEADGLWFSSEPAFTKIITNSNESEDSGVKRFKLSQSYPNPFNSTTLINYSLPHSGDVSLVIYNLAGREVMRWNEQGVQAGTHEKSWNGTDRSGRQVASGIYFYRLVVGGFSETRKMVLLR